MWQDFVLGGAIWVLLLSLLPTLISQTKKPALLTAIFTAIALSVIAATYLSLGFWSSAIPSALMAGAWFYLTYQRYRLDAKSDN
ncbi:hypothetical protein HY414_01260 [Candidatus Kaiserbacteria bacterium]|nr:hypothetical protein [Candidatus Kaiserbacteria bacterium]